MKNGNAYCRVFDKLQEPGLHDCESVSATCQVSRQYAANILTEFASLGLAHIAGWRINARLRLVSRWKAGEGDPVAKPSIRAAHLTTETVTGKFILEVLTRPMVVSEVAALVGSEEGYTGEALRCMARDQESPVYVQSWIRSIETGGASKPVYAVVKNVSKKKNVPCPPAMSGSYWKAARIKRVRAEFADSGYGEDTVKRVVRAMFRSRNDGGAMSVVIEGRTVYQRRQRAAE